MSVCGTGSKGVWGAAFLGDLGMAHFRPLTKARDSGHRPHTGICHGVRLPSANRSCPFDRLRVPIASPPTSLTTPAGAGVSNLLAIAYDYNILGLGPD